MSGLSIATEQEIKGNPLQRWRRVHIDQDIWAHPRTVPGNPFSQWKEVKFDKANLPSLKPLKGKQGIYMFVARPADPHIIHHSYILYVGETDDLEGRFDSYFGYRTSTNPSDQLKRIMTIVWEGSLYFNYIETTFPNKAAREELEFDLIRSIMPPMNDQFRSKVLSAKMKHLRSLVA